MSCLIAAMYAFNAESRAEIEKFVAVKYLPRHYSGRRKCHSRSYRFKCLPN